MTINTKACPLCGQSNRCAMEIEKITGEKQAPCWCTGANFSDELLARVPPSGQNLACICAQCAAFGVKTSNAAAAPPLSA